MRPPAPLLDPGRLEELRELLPAVGADGWLLYDFHGQNPLARELLGPERTTRRAFALFPRQGDPVLLHHAIEASAWRHWPWETRSYAGWRELEAALGVLLEGLGAVAMELSPGDRVPMVDRVPFGVVELVRAAGVEVVSSGDLVTAFHARWSSRGLELHREAARTIREIAHGALHRAGRAASGSAVTELALMEWIRARLRAEGLTDQEDCIVAAGARAADPHYHPDGEGAPLRPGALVLIDLWGRHPGEGVPADQTWMGFLGSDPPGRTVAVWEAVRDARDRALRFLEERSAEGREVRGWEVDDAARGLLEERGLARHFLHRLGHSIDRRLHGSGPDLDHLEARDDRRLLPGIGFSVEPGVYIPGELGVRSEVNVYWGSEGPEVTPHGIQRDLLLVEPR